MRAGLGGFEFPPQPSLSPLLSHLISHLSSLIQSHSRRRPDPLGPPSHRPPHRAPDVQCVLRGRGRRSGHHTRRQCQPSGPADLDGRRLFLPAGCCRGGRDGGPGHAPGCRGARHAPTGRQWRAGGGVLCAGGMKREGVTAFFFRGWGGGETPKGLTGMEKEGASASVFRCRHRHRVTLYLLLLRCVRIRARKGRMGWVERVVVLCADSCSKGTYWMGREAVGKRCFLVSFLHFFSLSVHAEPGPMLPQPCPAVDRRATGRAMWVGTRAARRPARPPARRVNRREGCECGGLAAVVGVGARHAPSPSSIRPRRPRVGDRV